MKKIVITLLLTAGIISIQAQTDQGDWMVGGGFRLNTGENSTSIGFTPNAAAFIIRNLAVGGNIGIEYSKFGNQKSTDFRIGPFLRYYFTQANVRPIVQGSFNYVNSQQKNTQFNTSTTEKGINFFLGAGAAIFLNDQVSLDAVMGYNHTKLKDFDGDGGFAFTIGFQVYLLQRQVEKIRGK